MPKMDLRPHEVEQRLREIEERVSKATAPPWSDDKGILWIPSFCGMLEAGVGVPRGADATFCAHAREDVPWLLSLLREREEENRRLREALGWLVHLNRGVSRGGGAPSMVEWEDAWQNAEWLVRGEQP